VNARLNWILFAAVLLLMGGNVLLFGGIPRWLTAGAGQRASKRQ